MLQRKLADFDTSDLIDRFNLIQSIKIEFNDHQTHFNKLNNNKK